MSISQIVIFVLIGVGVFLIIGALVYTKIIKPSTFGYTSSSFLVIRKLKKIFEELKKEERIFQHREDVLFDTQDLRLAALTHLVLGYKNVYLVANPLYWNIKKVDKTKSGKLKIFTEKKELDLPVDIAAFQQGVKLFKKLFPVNQNLFIIVPSLNKEFEECEINGYQFIKISEMKKFISEKENDGNKNFEYDEKLIISKIRKKKPKRTIFPKFKKSY